MDFAKLLKNFFKMIVKKEVSEIYENRIESKLINLPAFYILVSAPGLFFVLGIILLALVLCIQLFTQYVFPIDLILIMAGIFFLSSMVSFLFFRLMIKGSKSREVDTDIEIESQVSDIEKEINLIMVPVLKQYELESLMLKEEIGY